LAKVIGVTESHEFGHEVLSITSVIFLLCVKF